MKIYELTFTGTEKLFEIKEVNCLPKDAEVVPFNFNKPIYYSEKTGQYYYCSVILEGFTTRQLVEELFRRIGTEKEIIEDDVEDAKPICKTTGMPCCWCQPGSCEHRG